MLTNPIVPTCKDTRQQLHCMRRGKLILQVNAVGVVRDALCVGGVATILYFLAFESRVYGDGVGNAALHCCAASSGGPFD